MAQTGNPFVDGTFETTEDANGNLRQLHYLSGGDGLFAIYVIDQDGKATMNYIHKDYQGSFETITNHKGEVVERLSFDPWGRRRNPTNWTFNNVSETYTFDRGYTGHEHLDVFGLINMNGRMYDPMLGRFLSPDNYVQSPDYTQNFNRYSYVLNNPLKYTDPSGEFFIIDSYIVGFIDGFFSTGSNRLATAYNESQKRGNNDIKITLGLFATDPNKTFGGQVWEIISRVTWQAPQTTGGWFTT